MSKRLILCGTTAKRNPDTVEPYVEVVFRIVNASMFYIMSKSVEGNAYYRGYNHEKCYLSRTPVIADDLNFFSLDRASLGDLKVRQFVPLAITDNIAARGGRLKVYFDEVRFNFRFPGTAGRTEFTWFGDEAELVFPESDPTEEIGKLKKELLNWHAKYSSEKTDDLNARARAENLAVELKARISELTRPDTSLRGRVFTFANDVLAFLKERNCEPEWETAPPRPLLSDQVVAVDLPALQSLSVANHDALAQAGSDLSASQKTMEGIHYGYERRFKNRLSDLLLELKEHGFDDFELERNANAFPLGRYYCSNIRKIAERLTVVWSRMPV